MVYETLAVRREGAVLFTEIAAPPMNLLGPELVRDLISLIQQPEADNALKVLVFRSADPDYFISHVDVSRIKEYREEAAKLTGEESIALLCRHLSASHLVTIAKIEGRVSGPEFLASKTRQSTQRRGENCAFATFSHRTKHTTMRSERTYRCRRTRRFGVMRAETGRVRSSPILGGLHHQYVRV